MVESLDKLSRRLYCSQISFDSLVGSYHEALVKIERLTEQLLRLQEQEKLQ